MATAQALPVAPRTQAAFCLTHEHNNCPLFATDAWESPALPDDALDQAIAPDAG